MIKVWTWIGAVLGALAAVMAWNGSAALDVALSNAGMSASWSQLLVTDSAVRLALALGALATTVTLVGLLIPAVLMWSAATRATRGFEALDGNSAPTQTEVLAPLEQEAWLSTIARGLKRQLVLLAPEAEAEQRPDEQRIVAGAGDPARLFEPALVVDRPLAVSLFRVLPLALLGCGAVLGLFAITGGIHAEAQDLLNGGTGGPGVMLGLRSGLTALLVLTIAAVLTWVITSLAVDAARLRMAGLAQAVRTTLPASDSGQLAAGLSALGDTQAKQLTQGLETLATALQQQFSPALASMETSAATLAQTQTTATQTLVTGALDGFTRELTTQHGDQIKHLGTAIDKLRKQIDAGTAHLKAADAHSTSQFKEAIAELKAASIAQVEGAYKGFEALVGETVAQIQATSTVGLSATNQLLDALSREADGARTIQLSAAEIAAAARASRETVERFIALAERMRELHQSIAATPILVQPEGPLANPETTRRLSNAIVSLRKATADSLPEL
jgi:hypothetical protein